jgi:Na+-transporting methylmalonyl-CoA/oxaloacetate decarboxylase gamma subunit
MQSPLAISLIITAIGMGLVFVAILILWGLMEGLVKVTADKTARVPDVQPTETRATQIPADVEQDYKAEAAAAAVAIALSMRQSAPQKPGDSSGISPWQAVLRAGQLSQRTNSFNRKQRRTER